MPQQGGSGLVASQPRLDPGTFASMRQHPVQKGATSAQANASLPVASIRLVSPARSTTDNSAAPFQLSGATAAHIPESEDGDVPPHPLPARWLPDYPGRLARELCAYAQAGG